MSINRKTIRRKLVARCQPADCKAARERWASAFELPIPTAGEGFSKSKGLAASSLGSQFERLRAAFRGVTEKIASNYRYSLAGAEKKKAADDFSRILANEESVTKLLEAKGAAVRHQVPEAAMHALATNWTLLVARAHQDHALPEAVLTATNTVAARSDVLELAHIVARFDTGRFVSLQAMKALDAVERSGRFAIGLAALVKESGVTHASAVALFNRTVFEVVEIQRIHGVLAAVGGDVVGWLGTCREEVLEVEPKFRPDGAYDPLELAAHTLRWMLLVKESRQRAELDDIVFQNDGDEDEVAVDSSEAAGFGAIASLVRPQEGRVRAAAASRAKGKPMIAHFCSNDGSKVLEVSYQAGQLGDGSDVAIHLAQGELPNDTIAIWRGVKFTPSKEGCVVTMTQAATECAGNIIAVKPSGADGWEHWVIS